MILGFCDSIKRLNWKSWAGMVALGFVVSLAAFAALNSAEKKATREAQSVADETAERVKKTCGNAKLSFAFDWMGFKELDYTTGGFSREEALRSAGDRANRVGNAIIAVCGDPRSAKIKEEFSHINQIRFSPQSDEKNFRIDFSRIDDILLARFGAFGVIVAEDLTAEIRKQF